jgi:hypothetical protein
MIPQLLICFRLPKPRDSVIVSTSHVKLEVLFGCCRITQNKQINQSLIPNQPRADHKITLAEKARDIGNESLFILAIRGSCLKSNKRYRRFVNQYGCV